MPGYVTIIVDVQIEAGAVLPRHTHSGIESGYIVEGNIELPIQGRPTLSLMPGNAFQVPPETPHAGGQASAMKVRIASTYVVEKGKALSYPA
jgi:quercetin dioxygenase-like cupin family protein